MLAFFILPLEYNGQPYQRVKLGNPNSKEKTGMAEIVEGGIEEETVVIEEEVILAVEPQKEDFESEEEFTAALDQHKVDNPPEPWMVTDDDLDDVPVKTHIRVKQKLKTTISEQQAELERVNAENVALKASNVAPVLLKRPKEDDFDGDDEAYEAALNQYEHDLVRQEFNRNETAKRQKEAGEKKQTITNAAVDDHYKRADILIEERKIDPGVYDKADETVKSATESIFPGSGETIFKQFIEAAGEGSEKVMLFLGRNKAPLNEFKSLLMEDNTGLKAAFFLGKQQGILTNPIKPQSRAPAPAATLHGDLKANAVSGGKFKKDYDKEHKAGNGQEAWNVKKKARAAGVDVSGWA